MKKYNGKTTSKLICWWVRGQVTLGSLTGFFCWRALHIQRKISKVETQFILNGVLLWFCDLLLLVFRAIVYTGVIGQPWPRHDDLEKTRNAVVFEWIEIFAIPFLFFNVSNLNLYSRWKKSVSTVRCCPQPVP
jgi:hypothetical protein